eukprot:6481342-Prymnesium_polylepis.1
MGALCAVVLTVCVAGRWVGRMWVMCSRRVAVRMLAWSLGRAPAHLTELPEIKAPTIEGVNVCVHSAVHVRPTPPPAFGHPVGTCGQLLPYWNSSCNLKGEL